MLDPVDTQRRLGGFSVFLLLILWVILFLLAFGPDLRERKEEKAGTSYLPQQTN